MRKFFCNRHRPDCACDQCWERFLGKSTWEREQQCQVHFHGGGRYGPLDDGPHGYQANALRAMEDRQED